MPKTVDINVYMIGSTKPNAAAINSWLMNLPEGGNQEHIDQMSDFLGKMYSDIEAGKLDTAEVIPGLAAKRCYNSFIPGMNPNVTKVRENWDEYFENIMKSKHGAVLEHASFNFAIEGVSRVFTAEMNRHRAGWAISEGSMRFIRFDKEIPYWVPTSIQGPDVIDQEFNDCLVTAGLTDFDTARPCHDEGELKSVLSRHGLDGRKQLTRAIFDEIFQYVEDRYRHLLAIWDMDESDKDFKYKKAVTSCLRRIVPLGVATGGVWTGNIRALRHVLTLRCAPEAEEEIQLVFSTVAKMMSEQLPNTFGDFVQDEAGYWRPRHWKV